MGIGVLVGPVAQAQERKNQVFIQRLWSGFDARRGWRFDVREGIWFVGYERYFTEHFAAQVGFSPSPYLCKCCGGSLFHVNGIFLPRLKGSLRLRLELGGGLFGIIREGSAPASTSCWGSGGRVPGGSSDSGLMVSQHL